MQPLIKTAFGLANSTYLLPAHNMRYVQLHISHESPTGRNSSSATFPTLKPPYAPIRVIFCHSALLPFLNLPLFAPHRCTGSPGWHLPIEKNQSTFAFGVDADLNACRAPTACLKSAMLLRLQQVRHAAFLRAKPRASPKVLHTFEVWYAAKKDAKYKKTTGKLGRK